MKFLFAILPLVLCFAFTTRAIIQTVKPDLEYVDKPMTWKGALEYCRSMGKQLLEIHNQKEYNEVIEMAKKHNPRPSFWIAATDEGHEGEFLYPNKKKVPELWSQNQPDNGRGGQREDCLEFTYRWSDPPVWNDVPCESYFPFFCEGPPPPASDSCNACPSQAAAPPVNFCTSVYRC